MPGSNFMNRKGIRRPFWTLPKCNMLISVIMAIFPKREKEERNNIHKEIQSNVLYLFEPVKLNGHVSQRSKVDFTFHNNTYAFLLLSNIPTYIFT